MPATQLPCPKCNTVLKSSSPLPEGTKVKCRKCGHKFHVQHLPVGAGSRTAASNPFAFDTPAPAPLESAAAEPSAPAGAGQPAVSDAFVFDTPAPPFTDAGANKPTARPTVLPAKTAVSPKAPALQPEVLDIPMPSSPRAVSPLVIGLVVACCLLFIGVGVTLAVVCLSAAGERPTDTQIRDGEEKEPRDRPEIKQPVTRLPTDKPAEKPVGQPAEKPVGEKPVEKPAKEKPEAKPAEETRPTIPVEKPVVNKPTLPEKEPEKQVDKDPESVINEARLSGSVKLGPYLVTAAKPKELTAKIRKGIGYLLSRQRSDGGWNEGNAGGRFKGFAGTNPTKSNVAETCVCALVLRRTGSTPSKGKHAARVLKAVNFVCKAVEKADDDSLSLTSVKADVPKPVKRGPRGVGRGRVPGPGGFGGIGMQPAVTNVQRKIGPNVDTFLATMMLSEMRNHMPNAKSEERVNRALEKLIGKIERNQKEDGTWNQQAWAPVLGQALATKAINRARQAGAKVSDQVLERAKKHAEKNFDSRTGDFTVTTAAGVALYAASANLASIQDSVNTNRAFHKSVSQMAKTSSLPAERQVAMSKLTAAKEDNKTQQKASRLVIRKLKTPSFVKGFSSNGGEEFLSFMNISEAMAATGGSEWKKWDTSVAQILNRIQNKDGSWSGFHCIVGKTFCTAASLLTLMADRTPVPAALRNQ